MKTKNNLKLTLVGAGPGDPELITLKGIKALGDAGAVLYDALACAELLKFAPAKAPKIFVGKRSRNHQFTQDEINKLIVEYARNYGSVVRLKGGDPFVFGRGMEEIQYARLFGIETEVIPGISSSTGIAALSGIPVTHRGVSESFWVITGTTRNGKLSQEVVTAAHTQATVIILMGVGKLTEIVKVYENAGRHDAAVAIIQNGSLANEKIIVGTTETIGKLAKDIIPGAPGIILIGEVVKLHQDFPMRLAELSSFLN